MWITGELIEQNSYIGTDGRIQYPTAASFLFKVYVMHFNGVDVKSHQVPWPLPEIIKANVILQVAYRFALK